MTERKPDRREIPKQEPEPDWLDLRQDPRWLKRVLFGAACVLAMSLALWLYGSVTRCADGGCWMTDAERELWKYDGRGPVEE